MPCKYFFCDCGHGKEDHVIDCGEYVCMLCSTMGCARVAKVKIGLVRVGSHLCPALLFLGILGLPLSPS